MDRYYNEYKNTNQEELIRLLVESRRLIEFYESKMLNKVEVADRAGMTVSWLNNSYCGKAQDLREIGIRYGQSQTSPVRYPLHKVIRICHRIEA